MCVSHLENCNISGVECGKIRVLKKPSCISTCIAFSDYFLVYSKNIFNVKVCYNYAPGWSCHGSEIVVRKLSEYVLMGCYG
jgi:hypothetical protein